MSAIETVQVSQEKRDTVEETVGYLKKYEVVAAADLYKVGSSMLHDIRRQLGGRMSIKVVKNTLMRISMEEAQLEGIDEFMDAVSGPNVFLFTNGNPFKLAMTLEANKVRVFAKPGDIAQEDIVIKAGNTGLSPGPIIAKFGALGIRTRIEAGNIWVTQDVTAARGGEEISGDLADLLARMGIKAAEMGLRIKAVYESGTIIPGEDLLLDLAEYRGLVESAHTGAFQVAVQASYVTPVTAVAILVKATQQARKVAIEAGYLTRETVEAIIRRANAQARSLASQVGKIQANT